MTTTSYPKNKLKVLLLENVNSEAVAAFQRHGYTQLEHFKSAMDEEELIDRIKDVHILGIRSKTQVTQRVLDAAGKLLAVGCFCIGTNQVNTEWATTKGVAVFNAPYSNTRSVAELVIGAAIMLIRQIPEKNRLMHAGIWMKDASHSHELRGKTLGIIGYGNIGSQVSVLAEALSMRVIFYDIQTRLPLGNAAAADSLAALLQQADVITIHTPATSSTRNLIDAAALAHCKRGAILINYARGEVADMQAIKEALESGGLAGAAVDVYMAEPQSNRDAFACQLQQMPNVLLTPHVGGSTEEAQVSIGLDVSHKLLQYIETGATGGSHTIPQLSPAIQENTHRVLHIHRNVPGVLSEINAVLSAGKINILGQYLKTNDQVGYAILDISSELSGEAYALLNNVKETIKVRLLY